MLGGWETNLTSVPLRRQAYKHNSNDIKTSSGLEPEEMKELNKVVNDLVDELISIMTVKNRFTVMMEYLESNFLLKFKEYDNRQQVYILAKILYAVMHLKEANKIFE